MRKVLKYIGLFIIAILTLQTLTYFGFSKNLLIQEIGNNYESYALGIEDNVINNLGISSEMHPNQEQIEGYFPLVSTFNYNICKTDTEFKNMRNQKHFFFYCFDNTTRNPFIINNIIEGEGDYEYVATWESKYIWILYKWVLLEKQNTGIS